MLSRRSLFSPTPPLLKKLASVPFWRPRTQSLHKHSGPQMISKNYYKSAQRRRREPDDVSGIVPQSCIKIFKCPNCGRYKMIEAEAWTYYHVCCEIYEMRPVDGHRTMKKASHLHNILTSNVRKWDFDKMRPSSNPRWSQNRATSKLPKRNSRK